MAVSRIQNIMRTRDLLDSPLPNRPSAHMMLAQEISVEMDIVNQLNNTGIAWGISSYQLNYTPGISEYTINVDDFGKCLYVNRLTGNQYITAVPVRFADVSEQQYGYVWNNDWSAYGQLPFYDQTPEKMSFFRSGVMNSEIKVSIEPQPAQSWTYEIFYMSGYIGTDDPLESAIQMPEHAELVRLRCAMALLPYTEWGSDRTLNAEKRKELMMAFQYQLARKEDLFAKYITSVNIPRTQYIDSWNGR